MIKSLIPTLLFLVSYVLSIPLSFGQTIAEPFEFRFEDKILRGLIEKPSGYESQAIVIIIPGYGRTDFVEGKWFSTLRDKLVASGLTVCLWDKMGCGNSEGEFDEQQPVGNSAEEAIAAIQEIKRLKIPGSEKIGLWGLSRAGWICPLINEQFPINFWISVSGTDDKENFGYLLESNLTIAGKTTDQVEELLQAWKKGHQLLCTQASYQEYFAAIEPLRQDSTCRMMFGYKNEPRITEEDRMAYVAAQVSYTRTGHYEKESGLWVYIENFDEMLARINCPVLALFGANDSQVDWQKTKALYEKTIGVNSNAELTTQVFDQCNHSLQKCITCAYQEDLSVLGWQACDNYYETIEAWLKEKKIVD